MKEELQQEYMKFQMLDQQIKQVQKQLQMLEQQSQELTMAKQSVQELEKAKPGTDLLIPVSSGIFAKAQLQENTKLILNVGAKTAVTKDISQSLLLIETQITELSKVQKNLTGELQQMMSQAQELGSKLQKTGT